MPLMAAGLWARAAKSGFLGGDKTFQFVKKIYDQGQKFVQKTFSRTAVKENYVAKKTILPESAVSKQPLQNSLFWRIFPQNTNKTMAGELRRKAAYMFWGPTAGKRSADRIHLLGFAGFAFALSQNKEKDSVGEKIRSLFRDYSPKASSGEHGQSDDLSLQDFKLGQLIGKGCNAAVYEARLKTDEKYGQADENIFCSDGQLSDVTSEGSETESDFSIISEDYDSSIDDLEFAQFTPGEAEILWTASSSLSNAIVDEKQESSLIGDALTVDDSLPGTEDNYEFAVKMMFNYGVESNSESIYKAMIKELVPARLTAVSQPSTSWQNGNHVKKKSLPPHPNIVDMWGAFVDPMPCLSDSLTEYPAALPERFNPKGIGRNMTMFLVMKKYGQTLRDYLLHASPSMEMRLKIFAQILEGTVHMVQNGISHRDLKSDNILIDFEEGSENPLVIITDFGCCLADKKYGLKIPYTSDEIERGGNCALMAPEIACAIPGPWAYLDYNRADLWAVGTLAYEIFGMENPFYCGFRNRFHLDSWSYADLDLPKLPAEVPPIIRQLVYEILRRDSKKRPSPEMSANIVHLYLWAPNDWLSQSKKPSKKEMNDWLLIMVAETLLQEVFDSQKQNTTNLQLKMTFLARMNMKEILLAFDHIQNYVL